MAYEFLFSNNATTTLAESVSASATVLNVASGDGDLFPSPASGQAFAVTLVDAETGLTNEICYCTSRSGDALTVIRGQEGKNALSWSAGDTCANYITADVMENWVQESDVDALLTSYITSANALLLAQRASSAFVTYTSGTSLTAPSWATRFEVWATGGGGGGAGCEGRTTSQSYSGGGGGGGGTAYAMITVSSGASVALSIGGGGAGSSGASQASSGGDTTVSVSGSVMIRAGGGAGATWSDVTTSAGAPGGSVTVSSDSSITSQFSVPGGVGSDGQAATHNFSGNGGSSYYGGGGRSGSSGGVSSSVYGGGGGGAYDVLMSGTSYSGGSGAHGVVRGRFLP